MSSDRPWLDSLRDSSAALQGVLGALLEAERHFAPPASPLERLHQITNSPEWAWLQPLYRLIADVDHALAYAGDLPASETAAIVAHTYAPQSHSDRLIRLLFRKNNRDALFHAAAAPH